jgi:hypothetical protein
MRKLFWTIAVAATVVIASPSTRTDAMVLGSPTGVVAAIEDIAVTDQIHCRWGWPHHRLRRGWSDGCYHGFRRGVVAPFFAIPRLFFPHRIGPRFRVYRPWRRWRW